MMRARLKPDSEDKKAVDAVAAIILHDLGQSPFVLVELGESDRDLLNFILLLKKADRLGIKYSREGVMDLVTRDTGGRFTKRDSGEIEAQLRHGGRFGDFTGDWLAEAIGNEYRARAALAALQGKSPVIAQLKAQRGNSLPALILGIDPSALSFPGEVQTASAMPGGVTPHEFFEFYKDRCSEHTFSVLALRAEDFLDQVKEEPTPKERVELFTKYRSDLPDPSKSTPGFKEPRKVKVEYVTLEATAPRVTQAIPRVQAASTILSGLAGPMSVGGNQVTALFQAAHPALAETLPVREAVSQKMQDNLSPYQKQEAY